jgi:hypothetical protein
MDYYALGRQYARDWAAGKYPYILTAQRAVLHLTDTASEYSDALRGFREQIREMNQEYFDQLFEARQASS